MNIATINPYIRLATKSSIRPPYYINNRVIFDYELIYVAGGQCDITVDGEHHLYKKGDILLLTPGTEHRFDVLGDTLFMQPHIHFDMFYDKYSTSRYISYKTIQEMTDYERQMIPENIFAATALPRVIKTDLYVFEKLFFEIIRLYDESQGTPNLLCKARMCELIDLLFRDLLKQDNTQHTYSAIEHVKEYIDTNYTSNITLDSLAAQFYIDKYYLLRKFRETYGTTIIHYVKQQKCNAACKLLLDGYPVGEVSERLGFDSIYSFSRFFKNMTGLPPRKFAAQNKR